MSFAAVIDRLQRLDTPYPGLRPFETEEAHLFFGRDQQIAELVARLERRRFLAVLGVSGSGKSSLIRAGLIPALQRGQVSDAAQAWRIVVTRPAGAPFESLAADLEKAGLDASSLRTSSHGLIAVTRSISSEERLLVVVDQFEELFRYKDLEPVSEEARRRHAAFAGEAAEFVQLLLESSRHHPPVFIALTMRSDYLGDCAEFRDLPETLNECQYLVPRLTREQRKEAIEGPLGRVAIAPSLVQRMLNEAGDEPDQLPVLQHALMRTWTQWRKSDPARSRRIELQDYVAVGGFDGALNQHADETLAGASRDIATAIFKRLTARGRNNRERRDPATLRELWAVCGAQTPQRQADVSAVIDRFRVGEATFLTPRDGAIAPDTYIDITHESLIRLWRTLRDEWLPDEQRAAKTFLDLAKRARSWRDGRGELLVGLDLADANEWQRRDRPSAAWAAHYADPSELENVLACVAASRKQEQRRLRLRLWTMALVGGAATLFAALSVVALLLWSAARTARDASFARQLAAQSQLLYREQSQPPFDVNVAALLALESMRRVPTYEGRLALRESTKLLPRLAAAVTPESGWPVFSADGKLVAIERDAMVQVFDLATGAELSRFVPDAPVYEMAFGLGGAVLVTATKKSIQASDARTGRPVWTVAASDRASIVFSPDGGLLASIANEGPLRLFDANTGKELWSWNGDKSLRSLAFSGDGRSIGALSASPTVRVFETASGKQVWSQDHDSGFSTLQLSHDGRWIATTDVYHRWQLFNRAMRQPRSVPPNLNNLVFNPDGSTLMLSDNAGTVAWSAVTGEEIWGKKGYWGGVFSPDGGRVVLAHDNALDMVRSATGEVVWTQAYQHLALGRPTKFSEDGRWLFVVQGFAFDRRRIVRVIDAASGVEVGRTFQYVGSELIVGTEGRWMFATEMTLGNGQISRPIMVVEAYRPLNTMRLTRDALQSGAVDEDGRWLVPAEDEARKAYEQLTKNAPDSVTVERTFVTALSPDKRWLAVAGEVQGMSDMAGGKVRVVEVATGKPVPTSPYPLLPVGILKVAFSGDGRLLAVTSGNVYVFETLSGREVLHVPVHGSVNAMAFSAEGHHLAVAVDATAFVFDAASGAETSRITTNGSIASVRFSAQGRYLLTASAMSPSASESDVVIDRHFLTTEDLVHDGCSRMTRNLSAEEWNRYVGAQEPPRKTCAGLP